MSPLSLRRKYMPRPGRREKPIQAHQAAAATAAGAQKKHPQTPPRVERQTENVTATNRHTRVTLTRFKPGFEWETELQLASAFKRPPRLFKEDTPFYPWLPKLVPIVNFHLNFKG